MVTMTQEFRNERDPSGTMCHYRYGEYPCESARSQINEYSFVCLGGAIGTLEAYEKRQKLQSGASSAGSEWKDIFNAIMGIPRTFKAGWKAGQKQASESIVSLVIVRWLQTMVFLRTIFLTVETIGEALRQTWLCVAPFGRFIELGKKDIVGNTGIDMSPFMNNIIFAGVNMLSAYRDNIPLFGCIIADVMKCLPDGIIRPIQPLKVMNFSQSMQIGKHIGNMVLSDQPDDLVPIVLQTRKPYSFPENATYMIPGGLDGLGRAIAYWMVQQGAQHIVFTSQPGATKPEAQKLIAELHKLGAKTIAFACGISKVSQLQNVLTAVDKEFPLVKGIITCAMQLQDVLFENMSVEDFHAALRPKAQATRNLHNIDFFVYLSSTEGIVGSRGQGNYNAGNTFQDAIANHGRAHEQSARSINLGVVLEQEVLTTIQAAIAAQRPAQVFVGLATGDLLKQNDHDDLFWITRLAKGGSSDDEQLQTLLGGAKTMAEATDAVCTTLVRKLAKAMMIEVEDLDSSRPAISYRVDSLVTVEVHACIFKEVKSDVSVFEILSNTPWLPLAAKIASRSTLVSPGIRGDAHEA
ncbi:polyketide synthase [Talaromyces pinophilus]|uniref:Polyketide synthase n=1 Tax=Talaromyces pinophilus TaxID=128442 RepID=A0A0B8MY57_TALPI|nr:polyketide synthase [Talaromyces pinophilus]